MTYLPCTMAVAYNCWMHTSNKAGPSDKRNNICTAQVQGHTSNRTVNSSAAIVQAIPKELRQGPLYQQDELKAGMSDKHFYNPSKGQSVWSTEFGIMGFWTAQPNFHISNLKAFHSMQHSSQNASTAQKRTRQQFAPAGRPWKICWFASCLLSCPCRVQTWLLWVCGRAWSNCGRESNSGRGPVGVCICEENLLWRSVLLLPKGVGNKNSIQKDAEFRVLWYMTS